MLQAKWLTEHFKSIRSRLTQNHGLNKMENINESIKSIANAIYPSAAMGTYDAAGVYVGSLTEAIIGQTQALQNVADAINNVAAAIRGEP